LTSFGGAGNNYSMHAITEMVRQLRKGKGRNGLVLANGGVLTYQHVLCLSTMRRRGGSPYPEADPLPDHITDVPVPQIEGMVKEAQDATIEVSSMPAHNSPSELCEADLECLDIHRRIQSRQYATAGVRDRSSKEQQ
jgi:hypothetical protein